MSRTNKRNEKSDVEVYAIISQDNNDFYVGKIKKGNCYQAYKDHVRLRNWHSTELFTRFKEHGLAPKMYLLETIHATKSESYSHCVIWTRYFLDQGYHPIVAKTTIEYANDLIERNVELYLRIKDIPVGEIINDDHILISDYKPRKQGTRKNTISVCVTPDEYDFINGNARAAGLSMSKYCKEMALSGQIVRMDMSEYLMEIRKIKGVLYEIELAVLQNGEYYPEDIENIEKQVKILNQVQKTIVNSIMKQFKELRKRKIENGL